MTALTRKTQKVFAGNANVDQIAIMGTMKTGTPQYSGDVTALQSAEYELGWADAILSDKAPFLEEMNGVQYGFSYQLAYLLQEGVAEYDSATEYKAGSFCKSNGQIYVSLVDANVGNALSDTTKWQPAFLRLSGGTMTGNLRIDNTPPSLYLRNTDEVAGTTPSSHVNKQVVFQDNNGNTVGYVANQYNTDKSRLTVLNCRNSDTTNNASIAVGFNSSGVVETTAPTVAVDTTHYSDIVNVAFLRNYIKCGEISINPTSEATVSFVPAFPNNNYYVVLGRRSDPTTSKIVDLPWVRVKYAGSMQIYNPSNGTVTMAWAAIWRN